MAIEKSQEAILVLIFNIAFWLHIDSQKKEAE
jgi:hypothetical protein